MTVGINDYEDFFLTVEGLIVLIIGVWEEL